LIKSLNQKLPSLTKPIKQTRFMTPVYTQKGASRVLTKRTCRDHPTQIKFEINTQNRFDPLNPAAWKDIKTSRHQDIKTSRHQDIR
jgi:hypothetical protein